MKTHNFTFFWNGPFSQWCSSIFTIKGIEYTSAEQYMMAKKALLFNDIEAHEKIIASDSPSIQKAIGRNVKNFDKDTWEAVCKQYVYEGNMAKFTQNPYLLEELMATGDTEIVEASPYDKIWGIGLREGDRRALNKATWQGTNWLGEIVQQVREELKAKPWV